MKKTFFFKQAEDELAAELFEEVRGLPIVDWHNHLSIRDLAEDRRYADPAELWLLPDPYKHRAMRICGVKEDCITGSASNEEKFRAWCGVLPELAGNPLYFWSRLELENVFGIGLTPSADNAHEIWERMMKKLEEEDFSARGLLKKFHVEYAAPCIGVTDEALLFPSAPGVVPSFRGDELAEGGAAVLKALEERTGIAVEDLASMRSACARWIGLLHGKGCRFADHALDSGFRWIPRTGTEEASFRRCLKGAELPGDRASVTCEILRILAEEYASHNWTMQLHAGAVRRTSSRLRKASGPAGGYAAIGEACPTETLAQMLDSFESSGAGLPDVILYTLNPAGHARFASLSGSFTGNGERGKVQLGPAWWFCDHVHGMRDCFEAQCACGVLSVCLGMTTDSRSFLSFVRHEYFRRVFCAFLAEKAARGEMPRDIAILKKTAVLVCYQNAHERIMR